MNYLGRIFDFYISASLHVALSVVALTFITLWQLHLPVDGHLLSILFCGTVVSYNFVKFGHLLVRKATYQNPKYVLIVALSSICGFIFAIGFINFSIQIQIILAIAVVLSLLYALPLLPHKRNFRSLSTLKIAIVACCWALLTVILPIEFYNNQLSTNEFIMALQRFFLIVVLILPFDIRDLKTDSIGLRTFPQLIGIKSTKILGILLLLIFVGLLAFRTDITNYNSFTYIITALITALFLLFTKENSSRYYCSFWVEAIPIMWAFLYSIPNFYNL